MKLAKENNLTIKVRHAKVMVCGAAKAGKTSFTHLLRNKNAEKEYKSTNLGESKQISIKRRFNIHRTEWTDLSEDLEYQEVIQRLLSKLNKQNVKVDEKPDIEFNKTDDDQLANPPVDPTNEPADLVNKQSLTASEEHMTNAHVADGTLSTTDEIMQDEPVDSEINLTNTDYVRIPKELIKGMHEKALETWDLLTLLDTGGQPELINMLPAVNTSAAVSFIVFDLSKGVDCLKQLVIAQSSEKRYKQHEMNYTTLDFLKSLLSFIKMSARKKVECPEFMIKNCPKSGVCFIGTHVDKLIEHLLTLQIEEQQKFESSTTREPLEDQQANKSHFTNEFDLLLNNLIKSQKDKEVVEVEPIKFAVKNRFNDNMNAINIELKKLINQINKDASLDIWSLYEKNLIAVDNTSAGNPQDENHVAEIIRSRIYKKVEKTHFEIPISWFILELQLRNEKEVFISLDKVKALSDRIMPEGQKIDRPSIIEILKFFHALGAFMYFDGVDILEDYVITDPQWLFNTLTDLVNCTFNNEILDDSVSDAFRRRGILSDELLDSIELSIDKVSLNTGYDDQNDEKSKRKLFLELLKHLKIIAVTDQLFVGEYKDEKNQCYFMPSILPTCSWINEKDKILPKEEFGKQLFYKGRKKDECLVESLLIKFTYGTIPRGFLCFLAVKLLGNCKNWGLYSPDTEINLCQFDNLITFRVGRCQYFALIDRTFYLELQVRIKHEEDIDENPYFKIQCAVTYALQDICKDFNSQFTDLRYGFLCRECPKCSVDHLTLLFKDKPISEYISDNHYADCGKQATKLDDKHKIWFQVSNYKPISLAT